MDSQVTNKLVGRFRILKITYKTEGLIVLFDRAIKLFCRLLIYYIDRMRSKNVNKIHDLNYRILYYRLQRKRISLKQAVKKLNFFPEKPKLGVFIESNETELILLGRTLDSLKNQYYKNYTVFIVSKKKDYAKIVDFLSKRNDSGLIDLSLIESHLESFYSKYMDLVELYLFVNPGDLIQENAFFEVVKIYNQDQKFGIVYTDQDWYTSEDGYLNPFFKPDYSPQYLNSYPYIGNLAVYNSFLLQQFALKFKNRPIHNYRHYLNLFVKDTDFKVYHITDVLFHEFGMYHENALMEYQDILRTYYQLVDIPVVVTSGQIQSTYHVGYSYEKEKLVSIIIPFKDKIELLKKCVLSILEKPGYKNFELLLVSNNSELPETFDGLLQLQLLDERIHIFVYDIPFNFSKINNWASAKTKGEFLIFLNNDTEVINHDWIKNLMQQAMFSDVGAVGTKLLYPNGTIQHAGVVIGLGGYADHVFLGFDKNEPGYFNRLNCINNYSACSAACLLVKKSIFNDAGGFNESQLKVMFNDVDLCLKIRSLGYNIVYTPYVQLYHHESLTRGKDVLADDLARFKTEISYLQSRWKTATIPDPFYNPNLTLRNRNFSLRVIE